MPESPVTLSPYAPTAGRRAAVAVAFGPPIVAEGDPKYRPDVQALTERIGAVIGEQVLAARRMTLNGRLGR